MTKYDKTQLQSIINSENGIDYHKNVPLDGFIIFYGQSFVSFSFREVGQKTVAFVSYMYLLNYEDAIKLLGYCISVWQGYCVKAVYFMEHRRKSNIIKKLGPLGFEIHDITKENWKYNWVSTNGFVESDCIEAYTKVHKEEPKKTSKPRTKKTA